MGRPNISAKDRNWLWAESCKLFDLKEENNFASLLYVRLQQVFTEAATQRGWKRLIKEIESSE